MKASSLAFRCSTYVLLAVLMCSIAFAQAAVEASRLSTQAGATAQRPATPRPAGTTAVQPNPSPQGVPQPAQAGTLSAPQSVEELGARPLRVMVGKSVIINTNDRLRRVSVTDPAIADALVVTPNQVLVHGRAPGEVSLVLWDEQERSRSFDLRVDVDVSSVSEEIQRIFPSEKIYVSASRNAIVLSGHVGTEQDVERAGMIAGAYSKNVVNVLTSGAVGAQEIMLEVRFAEVDRSALTQLGVNLLSTGAGNTFGATGTQQFGPLTGSRIGAVTSDVTPGTLPPGNNTVTSEVNNQLFHQPGSFGTNDLLNIFLFRTDANIGAMIKALQQKNVLQILAEPNLMAMNGKEATFLAGGEFPFPVVQGAGALSSVTILFKEFGVRLKFIPLITPAGNIHLRVMPEVSALDFSNGITLSGFVVPALSTRRAETEMELQDGQSFAIAGLMDNRLTNVTSKIPVLGDIPILGTLFKSKNYQKSKTELMVLVTAHRVQPSTTRPADPKYPYPFLDDKQETKKPAGGQ